MAMGSPLHSRWLVLALLIAVACEPDQPPFAVTRATISDAPEGAFFRDCQTREVRDWADVGPEYEIEDPERGDFTVSLWFRLDDLPAGVDDASLVSKGNAVSSHVGWHLFAHRTGPGTAQLIFRIGAQSSAGDRVKAASSREIRYGDGAWHHVVAVIDRPEPGCSAGSLTCRNQVRLYVDDAFYPVVPGGGGATTNQLPGGDYGVWSPQPLRVGWSRNPANGRILLAHGMVDRLRLYRRALTRDEIHGDYAREAGRGTGERIASPRPHSSGVPEDYLYRDRFPQGIETAEDLPREIDIADPGDGDYSISLWFQLHGPVDGQVASILSKGNAVSDHGGWHLFAEPNPTTGETELIFRVKYGGRKAAAYKAIDYSETDWHHLVAVIDRPDPGCTPGTLACRNQVRVYLDDAFYPVGPGDNRAIATNQIRDGATIWTPQPLRPGWSRNPENGRIAAMRGRLDEVRVYGRALERAEVSVLAAAPPDFRETVVFRRTRDYCYRIPAVVEAGGVLYAFAERRHGYHTPGSELPNPCSDHGNIDIAARISRDGGRTWSAESVVIDHADYVVSSPAGDGHALAGNPTALVTPDGSVRLFYNVSTNSDGPGFDNGQHRIQDGDDEVVRRAFTSTLALAGDSVVAVSRTEITDQLVPEPGPETPAWRFFAFGPGHGIVVEEGPHAGRWLVPGDLAVG